MEYCHLNINLVHEIISIDYLIINYLLSLFKVCRIAFFEDIKKINYKLLNYKKSGVNLDSIHRLEFKKNH